MVMVPWSRTLGPTLGRVGSFGDYILWMCWFCIGVRVNVSHYRPSPTLVRVGAFSSYVLMTLW